VDKRLAARPNNKGVYQEVWYQDHNEMMERNASREPFVVALALAKDYSKLPHQFDHFNAVFEVVPTGVVLSNKSIETKVLRRLKT
jgi:hypothetical protein